MEGNEVEFNDALGVVQRINYWEQVASTSFVSLLSRDRETGLLGFETGLAALNNIFFEISGDLTELELESILKIKTFLDKAASEKEFFGKYLVDGLSKQKEVPYLINALFNPFKEVLQIYRMEITKLKKKHGYSNPVKENRGGSMLG